MAENLGLELMFTILSYINVIFINFFGPNYNYNQLVNQGARFSNKYFGLSKLYCVDPNIFLVNERILW